MEAPRLSLCLLFTGSLAIAACSPTTELSRFQYTPNGSLALAPHRDANSPSYRVIYSFGAPPDGIYPYAGVIGGGGTFYGTTAGGGAYGGASGFGTVFSTTTGGTEKVLHSFGEGSDGQYPEARMIDIKGTLYGTTAGGGYYYTAGGYGIVFSITTGGTEKVLHEFGRGTDGAVPLAGMIDVKGKLYGTTSAGGTHNAGTIFTVTTGGTEHVVHNFGKGSDGSYPWAGLIDVQGTLYGTTYAGGAYGAGTVFSIANGAEKVLHSFGKGSDGSNPVAELIDVAGTLYGTTLYGGASTCVDKYRCGTVFSTTTTGTERVLHSFRKGGDGSFPLAGLTDVGGTLYGTTSAGGKYHHFGVSGGTVFSITTTGTQKVLHSFGSGRDGFYPRADINYKGGSLIGTTQSGGASGGGTVFSLKP
jgi:uncharacterized repeat protein (TIGR03803 family)